MENTTSSIRTTIQSSNNFIKGLLESTNLGWSGEVDIDYLGKVDVQIRILDIEIKGLSQHLLEVALDMKIQADKTTGLLKGQAEVEAIVDGDIHLNWANNHFDRVHLDIKNIGLKDSSEVTFASIPISQKFISSILNTYQEKIDDSLNKILNVKNISAYLNKAISQSHVILKEPAIFFHPSIQSLTIGPLSSQEDDLLITGHIGGEALINEHGIKEAMEQQLSILRSEESEGDKLLNVMVNFSYSWLNLYIKNHLNLGDQLPAGVRIDDVLIGSGSTGLKLAVRGDIKGITSLDMEVDIIVTNGLLYVQDIHVIDVEGGSLSKVLFNLSKGFVIGKIKSVINQKLSDVTDLVNSHVRNLALYSKNGIEISVSSSNVEVHQLLSEQESITLQLGFADAQIHIDCLGYLYKVQHEEPHNFQVL